MEPCRPRALGPRGRHWGGGWVGGGPAAPSPERRAAHSHPRQTAGWLFACPPHCPPWCSALFPALPGHGSATNSTPCHCSSAVPRAPRPVLRLHCAGVEVPGLGCSPAQERVSGPFREPHVAGRSQGYLGSPSAQPGRWDVVWDTVTRVGRAGPQGPGLLGVQGLQGRLTLRGGDSPGQVRDTPGTLAPLPAGALSQGRPGRPPHCPRVTYSPPRIPLPPCGPRGPRSLGGAPGKSRGASSRGVESRPEAGLQPPASGWAWVG